MNKMAFCLSSEAFPVVAKQPQSSFCLLTYNTGNTFSLFSRMWTHLSSIEQRNGDSYLHMHSHPKSAYSEVRPQDYSSDNVQLTVHTPQINLDFYSACYRTRVTFQQYFHKVVFVLEWEWEWNDQISFNASSIISSYSYSYLYHWKMS